MNGGEGLELEAQHLQWLVLFYWCAGESSCKLLCVSVEGVLFLMKAFVSLVPFTGSTRKLCDIRAQL